MYANILTNFIVIGLISKLEMDPHIWIVKHINRFGVTRIDRIESEDKVFQEVIHVQFQLFLFFSQRIEEDAVIDVEYTIVEDCDGLVHEGGCEE